MLLVMLVVVLFVRLPGRVQQAHVEQTAHWRLRVQRESRIVGGGSNERCRDSCV